MKLFAENEVNIGRQIEADMAKFVCLVGVVLVHSLETLPQISAGSTTLRYVFFCVLNYLFGATTFMFCMGLGIAYSRRNTPVQLMKRGIQIFLIGYLLNLIRALCYLVIFQDVERFFSGIWGLDILQFAGLSLLLFGCLKWLKLPDWSIGLFALLMSAASSGVFALDLKNHTLNQFLGLFIGTFDYQLARGAVFPLCNGFLFVAAGYLFGQLLRRCENKWKFYGCFSIPSAAIVAVYMIRAIPHRFGMMGNNFYFHAIRTPEALICIAAALFELGGYYMVSHLLPPSVHTFITRISRNINTIYCLQWVLLFWVAALLIDAGHPGFSDGQLLLLGGGIFILCAAAAELWSRWRNRREKLG